MIIIIIIILTTTIITAAIIVSIIIISSFINPNGVKTKSDNEWRNRLTYRIYCNCTFPMN